MKDCMLAGLEDVAIDDKEIIFRLSVVVEIDLGLRPFILIVHLNNVNEMNI